MCSGRSRAPIPVANTPGILVEIRHRFWCKKAGHFNRVHKKYLKIAEREKERVVMVDARHSIPEVHEEIVSVVRERLIQNASVSSAL